MKRVAAALCAAVIGALFLPQPAQAAGLSVYMYQPAKVYVGQTAKVDVKTAPKARCTINGRSPLYATTAGAVTWTWTAATAGTFTQKVTCIKGTTSGSHSRSLNVLRTWHNVATFTGTGERDGPVIRIPTASYRVKYAYTCTDPEDPFWGMAFLPKPIDYLSPNNDVVTQEGLTGSGYWNGTHGAREGQVIIGTWDDCTWSATIQSYY